MFFCIDRIAIDYDRRPLVLIDNQTPIFSWAARHSEDGAYQTACRVVVNQNTATLWDSGWVCTRQQQLTYAGAPLPSDVILEVQVTLRDHAGRESASAKASFRYQEVRQWQAKWITTAKKPDRQAKYFCKPFSLDALPVSATLYACGIGYQYVTLNGVEVEDAYLSPAMSHYKKHCYYTVTDVTAALRAGSNNLRIVVGDGWRDTKGFFENDRKVQGDTLFFGDTQLIAELELRYADGTRQIITTDESWLADFGAIVSNSLFDGEVWDMREAICGWDSPDFDGTGMASAVAATGEIGPLVPQTCPPVTEQYRLQAKIIRRQADGSFIFDFGQNIAGIGTLTIPENIAPNTRLTVEYAEELLPNGDLDKETLRKAKATDVFIAGDKNPATWTPRMTYHGFRYAKLSGFDFPADKNTLVAIVFCNDIKK